MSLESAEDRGPGENDTLRCKLFGDRVTSHLCILRRQELITQGNFSCDGCTHCS